MTSDSHFSWLRTRMSLERTLMSWVRTAVSLIGFGFTIVQFFERFSDMQGVQPALRPQSPRLLGLALILSGCGALAISVWQYRTSLRYLWSKQFAPLAGIGGEAHQTPLYRGHDRSAPDRHLHLHLRVVPAGLIPRRSNHF